MFEMYNLNNKNNAKQSEIQVLKYEIIELNNDIENFNNVIDSLNNKLELNNEVIENLSDIIALKIDKRKNKNSYFNPEILYNSD